MLSHYASGTFAWSCCQIAGNGCFTITAVPTNEFLTNAFAVQIKYCTHATCRPIGNIPESLMYRPTIFFKNNNNNNTKISMWLIIYSCHRPSNVTRSKSKYIALIGVVNASRHHRTSFQTSSFLCPHTWPCHRHSCHYTMFSYNPQPRLFRHKTLISIHRSNLSSYRILSCQT
jgi:hypothetical protein